MKHRLRPTEINTDEVDLTMVGASWRCCLKIISLRP
jgi:hypothetical protein